MIKLQARTLHISKVIYSITIELILNQTREQCIPRYTIPAKHTFKNSYSILHTTTLCIHGNQSIGNIDINKMVRFQHGTMNLRTQFNKRGILTTLKSCNKSICITLDTNLLHSSKKRQCLQAFPFCYMCRNNRIPRNSVLFLHHNPIKQHPGPIKITALGIHTYKRIAHKHKFTISTLNSHTMDFSPRASCSKSTTRFKHGGKSTSVKRHSIDSHLSVQLNCFEVFTA
ncbi:hypothetical protein VIGAN_07246200 [Vigna angularis var. angularis]|uniref:Uncharacterized protein n=1 Tax=Vigna angularis var. angularis TaxID=157739 RepID=A0A0S3SKV4_PHAAN|nr:hypothetical protein VIGAN_07246200 [Vigna angularis var. angularis]